MQASRGVRARDQRDLGSWGDKGYLCFWHGRWRACFQKNRHYDYRLLNLVILHANRLQSDRTTHESQAVVERNVGGDAACRQNGPPSRK